MSYNLRNFSYKSNNSANVRYNFHRANFPLMYNLLLQADWSPLKEFTDVNDACDNFCKRVSREFRVLFIMMTSLMRPRSLL